MYLIGPYGDPLRELSEAKLLSHHYLLKGVNRFESRAINASPRNSTIILGKKQNFLDDFVTLRVRANLPGDKTCG